MCVVTGAAIIAMGITASTATASTIALAVNVVMAVTMVGGIAMTAYGQIQQGKAEKRRYEYQAAVQRNNQKVAEWNAQDAIERGDILEKQHRMKMSKLQGKQRSVLAAQGIELESGSALDVLQDTAYFGEMDALTIRNNAQRDSWKYKVNAQNRAAQAGLLQTQGRDAMAAANMNATSTVLNRTGSSLMSFGAATYSPTPQRITSVE